MRLLVILVFLFMFVPPVTAQETTLPEGQSKKVAEDDNLGVFRGFVWGLPPTVILENEVGTFMAEDNGSLFYLDYIRGLKTTIAYEFLDNKFWRSRIFIEKNYSSMQDRIRDLMLIRKDLTDRYGEPVAEDFRWEKNTEKNYPDSWGWAVYRSELFITIVWQDQETEVTAYLGAKNQYDPQMIVTYVDRRTKEKVTKDSAKKLLLAP